VRESVRGGCLFYYDYFCKIIIHNIINLHFLFCFFSCFSSSFNKFFCLGLIMHVEATMLIINKNLHK